MSAARPEFDTILGYYELEMWDDALAEIDAVEAQRREAGEETPTVELNELRLIVHQGAERWTAMRRLAETCAAAEPGRASWFISWAYALRREESIPAARRVLRLAEPLHPLVPLVSFNLACYAAQLGELEEARRMLGRALEIEPALRRNALDDPDLEPLRRAGKFEI